MSTCDHPPGAEPDLADLELWAAWVSRLMACAATRATDERTRRTLLGASEDAQSLREALGAATTGWLDPGQTAVLRSIFELWDANQDRLERLAATVAPEWHRMWLGRSAGARRACAGRAHQVQELSSI